ncbi:DUF4012 domain-containing protein [Curtobacterium sp. MCLR17_007]|uniref:DUF4012 domain-containing protein n=1 Tax=Curtobacterium sp. MCLR17_007 TaxID=2175648 RepID=UPI000DA7C50B|nr:DUF4012 domain-containing protein [Curtobacterium sp. MCLR17_007]WIB60768.1 DUF4012 domain-containing protein [Curtobacterium sp. MCLR17_007]
MSDLPQSRRLGSNAQPHRRVVLWVVLAVVVLALFVVAWISIRGVTAKRDLEQSVSSVDALKSQLADGDAKAAQKTAAELEHSAAEARSLTGDPIWGLCQYVPVLGSNFRAVREVAVVVDDVARGAVSPVAGVVGEVSASGLAPKDGRIDLTPILKAQPAVTAAASTLKDASHAADDIETSDTLSTVSSAVGQLRSALEVVAIQADVANRVVSLAPSMLGQSGTKQYLVLFQNNAELRAGGGNPGALALLTISDGKITLGQQASTSDFPQEAMPVLPLSDDTKGLYGSITGQYVQDVTLTPRFDVSAELAREMWKRKFGTEVDGVIAVDPVTLGYILRATGPLQLPTGDQLTSDNASQLLLSEAYSKYSDPRLQDAFFASAASAVFSKVSDGGLDPKAFVEALTTAASEGRVRVWSADAAQQKLIEGTAVAGQLPKSTAGTQRFGVYLNDATGAKMDYYLDKRVSVGSQVCRRDGRPTWVVSVTLKNTAPADAASTLPGYVTGSADYGVTPGEVRTNVAIYAPASAIYLESSQSAGTSAPQTASDGEFPVTQFQTTLAPGKSVTVTSSFLGPKSASRTAVDALSTPGLHQTKADPRTISCADPVG